MFNQGLPNNHQTAIIHTDAASYKIPVMPGALSWDLQYMDWYADNFYVKDPDTGAVVHGLDYHLVSDLMTASRTVALLQEHDYRGIHSPQTYTIVDRVIDDLNNHNIELKNDLQQQVKIDVNLALAAAALSFAAAGAVVIFPPSGILTLPALKVAGVAFATSVASAWSASLSAQDHVNSLLLSHSEGVILGVITDYANTFREFLPEGYWSEDGNHAEFEAQLADLEKLSDLHTSLWLNLATINALQNEVARDLNPGDPRLLQLAEFLPNYGTAYSFINLVGNIVENRNDKAKAEALMESEFVDFEWSAAQDLMFMPPNSPDYQELAQAAAKIHVGEFANPFKAYSADVHAPHDLLEALSGQVDGIEVDYQSVNYIGADEAVSFFSPFDFGGAVRMGNPGVLLTSGGGMPPLANTMDNYTGISDTPGDAQFDQIVKAAFPGAGKTYDASILEFSFNVVDPAITSLRFDLIFGSEEYPDYIDTSYVDIAAVIVNDENYALFDGDPARPMSVIGNNVESGTLLDNMENQYAIEYNGISPRISIMVPLSHGGEYDVRIGVADTGDEVLDSGLFVSNMTTSATSASGMYVTQAAGDSAGSIMSAAGPATATLFEAGLGNDVMTGSVMPDIYDLTAGGENVIRGTVEQLNGDTIVGFSEEDAVEVKNVSFTNDDMLVEEGSAILRIDTTGDNQRDLTIRLEGEYDLSGFSASATDDGGTQVRYHASGQEFDSESDHGPTGSSGGGGGGAIIEEVVDAENGADEEPLDMELPREDSIALLNDVFTVVLSDIVNDHEALVREAYSVFLSLDGDFTNAEQRVGWWVSELDSEALDTDNFVAAFLDKADTHQGRYVPDAYFEVNQQLVPFVLSTTSQWAQEFAEADLQHAMLIEMIRDSVDGVANGLYEGAPLYTESGLESSNQGPSTHNIQVVGNGDEGEDWLVA